MIPKEFDLAGVRIKVELDPNLFKERDIVGEAQYHTQKIILDSSILDKDMMHQNFFHELTHWICYVLNEDILRNNEKFVDTFGHLLHQAMKTGADCYTQEEICCGKNKKPR